ncbi:MAG: tetratricopeptide repeat protein, partial [Terriglobia bacterium]
DSRPETESSKLPVGQSAHVCLEAKYEQIWTAFWWFDDVQIVSDSYGAFETLALQSDHARNMEFLCNLFQLLVNSIVHGHMSRAECRLDERTANLMQALESMAGDRNRPNNRLEAQTSLLIIRLNRALIDQKRDDLPDIWRDFAAALDRATGLCEFNADRLVSMIEHAGQVAGNDPAYNDLIERLAEFVANRTSEAEGALILLKRAKKLDFSDHFDMIRLLGKAAVGLTKKEHADNLIEALQLLMLAYRSAGLLWAARASCVFVTASIIIEGEEGSHIPVSFVPTMKIWAWLALELRHLPDFLYAIQLLNGALVSLPLAEESQAKVREDIRELEFALGRLFLNLSDADLRQLENVPDILEALGLFTARSALLYTLGHEEKLRDDGSLPKEERDEEVNRLFSLLASQPIAQQTRGPMILNGEGHQSLFTTILGMTVEISAEGNLQSILVAEAVLGSLEAFFATAIDQRVIPHTEKLRVDLIESAEVSQPAFAMSAMDMTATLTWP